jgi:Fe-S-cluster containining protein
LAFLSGARRPTVPPPVVPAPAPAAEAKPPPERALTNAVYFRTLDALRSGRSVAAVSAAVREARDRAERLWAERRPEVEARKTPGLACAAGCAWCCYQQVAVEPLEAIAIARHIAELPAETRAALAQRLAETDERTRGLGLLARARLKEPCAFLADGRCSIYEVRPLRCRGIYSRDAGHCRWAMENPDLYFAGRGQREGPGPYPTEPTRIVDLALTGLHRATRDFGLPLYELELVAAVRTALAAPDVSQRYLNGEPVFAAAALPQRDEASATALAKSSDSP